MQIQQKNLLEFGWSSPSYQTTYEKIIVREKGMCVCVGGGEGA